MSTEENEKEMSTAQDKKDIERFLRWKRATRKPRQPEPINPENPPPDIYHKSLTFTHISIEDDPKTGEKFVQAEDVDYYVTEKLSCQDCDSTKYVYLVACVSGICRVCFRCSTTQGILSKEFGETKKTYRMDTDKAIYILKGRGASKGFLKGFRKIKLRKPVRMARPRPKARK